MGDDCVALLEKILAETIRLRESMEARDAERLRLLKELRSKLDRENADPVIPRIKNNRKRKRNDVITQQCLVCLPAPDEKIPPEKFAIYFCGSHEEALMQAEDIFPSGKNKEKFSKNSNCSCREFKKALVKIVKNPKVKWGTKNQEVDEEGEDDLDNEDEEEETKDDSEEELESEEEKQKADKKFKRSKHNQESSFEETLDEESSEDDKVKDTSESEEPKKKKTKTQQETPQVKDAEEKKEEVQEKSKDKPDDVWERERASDRAYREKCEEAKKREKERRISTPPTVEEILDKMNYDLVMSLTVEAPDVPKCLKIITQISEMEINLDILMKNLDIVQTIKRIRNYKQNIKVREKASQLYTQFKSKFKVTGSESAADRLLSIPSSDPSSSLNTTTSAEGNERTEPEAVKDSQAQVSVKSEENTQPHPIPTENGSEHHVSSVEPKVEDQENRTKECIPEEKRPELDTSVDNLTPEPMEIQNDTTEM